MGEWADRRPNQKFPHCAQVARRLLAEVWGCKPGDLIPGEERLIERATQVRDRTIHGDADKAFVALAMLEEIGGL
jgi:hypothetical protein